MLIRCGFESLLDGLGSDDMPGALHLLVYDNADQSNVTFSPRISYGYYEPAYYPEFDYVLLDGTGIHDEHMVVKGLCLKDCFTWPAKGTDGGRIDVNSTEEMGIYALGPLEGFASDKVDESLKFHAQYGTFIMDMARAHGATEPPPMDDDTRSTGAKRSHPRSPQGCIGMPPGTGWNRTRQCPGGPSTEHRLHQSTFPGW